jgi:2-polyprenyl-6-methoxyphenol hydroxylase-like FAD-dependent oxidoreductase
LLREGDRVTGVRAVRNGVEVEVHARITVGADGRGSRIASLGGFTPAYEHYHFDVLWFSLPRPDTGFDNTVRFYLTPDNFFLVAPKHPDLIQVGVSIPPGGFATYRNNQGIEAIRKILAPGPAVVRAFSETLIDYKPFHPLKAQITLMKQWAQDGLLLIGDAAHTCSPVGGVGVSIAAETAAVAAGVILSALAADDVSAQRLDSVRQLREPEVRTVHRLQRMMGNLMTSDSALQKKLVSQGLWLASRLHLPPILPQRLLAGDPHPLPLAPALCARP